MCVCVFVCVSLTITLVDIIADLCLGQGVSAADGSVVSSMKTLTISSLTAAHQPTADFPLAERVLAGAPWRPL